MTEFRDEFEYMEQAITVRWPLRVRLLLALDRLRTRWRMRKWTPERREALAQLERDVDREFWGLDD